MKNFQKAFSLVEIGIMLFIMTGVIFVTVPLSVSNINQARYISAWKDYFNQVKYSFEILNEYKKTNVMDVAHSVSKLMEYLDARLVADDMQTAKNDKNIRGYKYKMMNGHFYQNINLEKFDEVYMDIKKRLVGIEYGDKNCSKTNAPCATAWVDLNGRKKPNTVGKDILIYEIYPNSVEPYGKGMDFSFLKTDCSRRGTGKSCSKFYLLGGDLK